MEATETSRPDSKPIPDSAPFSCLACGITYDHIQRWNLEMSFAKCDGWPHAFPLCTRCSGDERALGKAIVKLLDQPEFKMRTEVFVSLLSLRDSLVLAHATARMHPILSRLADVEDRLRRTRAALGLDARVDADRGKRGVIGAMVGALFGAVVGASSDPLAFLKYIYEGVQGGLEYLKQANITRSPEQPT